MSKNIVLREFNNTTKLHNDNTYEHSRFKDAYIQLHNQPNAGLFAHISALLGMIQLYEEKYIVGFEIKYDKGLYADKGNWFMQYFEPILLTSDREIRYTLQLLINWACIPKYNLLCISEFTIPRQIHHNNITKYLHLLPHIKKKIDDYYDKYMKGKYIIGVAYRGTDKPSEAPYVDFDTMFKYIEFNYEDDAIFYIASDETSFINSMEFEFGKKFVLCQDCIRSNDGSPIHLDERVKDKYLMGEQAIIDCYLLSKCNKLIRNSSNLSLISKYLNPTMEVIEVHQRVYNKTSCFWRYEDEKEFKPVPLN